MKNIYVDGEYIKKNPLYHVEDSPWKAQQILKMLNRHNLQIASVCEVGCGAGEVIRQLQLLVPGEITFHGYEISPEAFNLCRQRENQRLHFYCEDLLSITTQCFDLLLCIDVVEHVEDYIGFLKRLRQRAKYKIFHIPLDISVQTVLRCTPILQGRATVGHLHYFTKETALLTIQDAGYEVVDHFYTPSSVDLGKTMKSKLTRMPRIAFSHIAPDYAVRLLGGYSLLVLAK
jgi:2-polyprenyl-3-methyl-5-hydroxy-6-metoxy-1,4-benzoquinol methylase